MLPLQNVGSDRLIDFVKFLQQFLKIPLYFFIKLTNETSVNQIIKKCSCSQFEQLSYCFSSIMTPDIKTLLHILQISRSHMNVLNPFKVCARKDSEIECQSTKFLELSQLSFSFVISEEYNSIFQKTDNPNFKVLKKHLWQKFSLEHFQPSIEKM